MPDWTQFQSSGPERFARNVRVLARQTLPQKPASPACGRLRNFLEQSGTGPLPLPASGHGDPPLFQRWRCVPLASGRSNAAYAGLLCCAVAGWLVP